MPISGRKAIKILQTHGFILVRQKGSHAVLAKEMATGRKIAVIPVHKELAKGTLRSIANQSGIDFKEFGL